MSHPPMLLGTHLGQPYGNHPGAWRMPHAIPGAYTDVEQDVRAAQSAERGGLDFIFYPDRVFIWGDLETGPPIVSMEPTMMLVAIARATRRIGLVPSISTSFNEPYGLARQLRALDVMSRGRAGWNAIPSYEPEAFANYGLPLPSKDEKYERLHEVIQVVQALWASWGKNSAPPDRLSGKFTDTSTIRPINMRGRHVGSRGPLQIPSSEQGNPVIFMPFASGNGIHAAAMYANGIIAMAPTIDDGRAQRQLVRSLTENAGRNPDEVKHLSFVMFGLGATQQEAVQRRMLLEEAAGLEKRMAQLSSMLGFRLDPARCDVALSSAQVAALRPGSGTPSSARAVELARQGLSPREMLGHGILDVNPGLVGTAEQAADLLQEWMEAGATDGFIVGIDDLHDGMDDFVDQVVPILRRRGLRAADYDGMTLRHHLHVPDQLGTDPRLDRERQSTD